MKAQIPASDDRLMRVVHTRLFPYQDAEVRRLMKKYPGRWDNKAHFLRSALVVFLDKLNYDEEFRTLSTTKKQKVKV